MKMMHSLLAASAGFLIMTTVSGGAIGLTPPPGGDTHHQTDIAEGCAPPPVQGGRHFYVDPQKGSIAGDGSRQHPWRTLEEVFDIRARLIANAATVWRKGEGLIKANPNAPIKGGDFLELMSGNHGKISMQGYFGQKPILTGYNNSEFITIEAASGQVPIIESLKIIGAGKWRFRNLIFEKSPTGLVAEEPFTTKSRTGDYVFASLAGPNHDIIFEGNIFRTQADVSKWTIKDWLYKRASGISNAAPANCLSISNNRFYNIGFAIGIQRANNVLIKDNIIDMFADDGIDYGSDNTVIEGNIITNSIDDGDGFHRDAMQGQPLGQTPVSNVTIRNNTVINQTRELIAPADLQGIDTFDGVWRNVTVTNNIVATNAYHGIAYAGVDGIKIINNTVIGTNNKIITWITVGPSKDKRPSQNVVVRNNIATFFIVNPADNFDHNMMSSLSSDAVKKFKPSPHIIADQQPQAIFQKYNNSFYSYNFKLTPSRAIGSGSPVDAPHYGRDGALRGSPPDLGALAYQPSPR